MDDFKFDPRSLDRWLNELKPSPLPDEACESDFRRLFDRVHDALALYLEEHECLLELHQRLEESDVGDECRELAARTANVVRALWQVLVAHRNLAHLKDETLIRALNRLDARISRLEE